MKMKIIICRAVTMTLLIGLLVLLIAGCGSAADKVPDTKIEQLIKECDYSSMGEHELTAKHNVDAQNHTDIVDIQLAVKAPYADVTTTCTAEYVYDRSSDLWTLVRQSEWSDAEYQFNSNLVGDWHIDYYGNKYDIRIHNVNDDKIHLEYSIAEDVYVMLRGHFTMEAEGGGTYTLTYSWIDIPIELPDGYYVSIWDTEDGKRGDTAELHVGFDPVAGVESAYFSVDIEKE